MSSNCCADEHTKLGPRNLFEAGADRVEMKHECLCCCKEFFQRLSIHSRTSAYSPDKDTDVKGNLQVVCLIQSWLLLRNVRDARVDGVQEGRQPVKGKFWVICVSFDFSNKCSLELDGGALLVLIELVFDFQQLVQSCQWQIDTILLGERGRIVKDLWHSANEISFKGGSFLQPERECSDHICEVVEQLVDLLSHSCAESGWLYRAC